MDRSAQQRELADLVMRANQRPSRGGGLKSIGSTVETLIAAADAASKDHLCQEVSYLVSQYNILFEFDIRTQGKPDAMERIYRWCVGNGLDPDWTKMSALAMAALKGEIENVIEQRQYEDF